MKGKGEGIQEVVMKGKGEGDHVIVILLEPYLDLLPLT